MSDDQPITSAQGVTGSMALYRDRLVLKKKGWPYGTKTDKSIPIRSIGAVQWKQPGLTNGYLQIAYSGSGEQKGGVFQAASD